MNTLKNALWRTLVFALPVCCVPFLAAQETEENEDEEIFNLSPFEVSSEGDVGYMAANTLAGTRLRTDLRDVGSAISVYTEEFLQDIGATDNQSLLSYAINTEVGGTLSVYTGNGAGDSSVVNEGPRFPNPSTTTRVRGLAPADNTRDYFLSRIPWDGFNIQRVDINRGANSILFGLGSPAGIINYTTAMPEFFNSGEIQFRAGSYGSTRAELDINREIVDDVLAIRFAAVRDHEQYRQNPAFEDDERIYAAIRWDPHLFQKQQGNTSFRANYESGDIKANRPRTVTPVDFITPWFAEALTPEEREELANVTSFDQLNRPLQELAGIGKQTFTPYQLEDDYSQDPFTGQRRSNYLDGSPNPHYNPAIGNFAQLFGGPLAVFPDHQSPELSTYYLPEWRNVRGIGPDGAIDGNLGAPYQRLGGVGEYRNFASGVGLPFSDFGQYKNFHLQDPSIFNFYDQLLDGPNKQEKQDWTAYNISFSQNFWNNKFGFELVYDDQSYFQEGWALLTDQRAAIHIDINREWADGNPNPNVGRPFVSDNGQYGNSSLEEDRDVWRATAYADLKLEDFMDESLLTRILGRHVLTGLYSVDEFERDERSWMLFSTPQSYDNYVTRDSETLNSNDNVRIPNAAVYLGQSLMGMSSASGANIPNPTTRINMSNGPLYSFDSTWNSPGVDPAAPWTNIWTGDEETQSENPANYAGWTNFPLEVQFSEDGYRDLQTTSADLFGREVTTKAFVWQGYFMEGAIVTTYGYRDDRVQSNSFRADFSSDPYRNQFRNVDPSEYRLPNNWTEDFSDTSETKGVVVHVNELINDRLPINVSLSYLDSENFNPVGARRDIYGGVLGPPSGGTEDYGILLSTKDNRYSFRVTKFETFLENATSSAIAGDWFLGAVMAWGGNWANVFEYNLDGFTMDTAMPDVTEGNRFNYSPAEGETMEDAQAREAAAIAGFRALQDAIDPRYFDAWGLDPSVVSNQNASAPPNFSLTEDSVSKGYEFELTANPTKNWRISLSASKTKASRFNVGGDALIDFVTTVNDALNNTPAGDLRIWWGGAGNTTALREWNANFYGNYSLKKLQEGTASPEIRQWNATLVTNYSFTDGWLEGFNVGGSYRWRDEVVIGYPVIETADGFSYDLNSPYHGPSEDFIDLWFGYQMEIAKGIDWRIQVNVRNAFEDDGLIPISVQPDGKTWAAVRIKPETTWFITNSFLF